MKTHAEITLKLKETNMVLFVKNVDILIIIGKRINGVMNASHVDLETV